MKIVSHLIKTAVLAYGIGTASMSHAQFAVIDTTSIAQQIQQVAAWAKQYGQMVQQINQLESAYNNMSGVRGMGSLVNNPLARQYLPAEYSQVLSQGVGQWQSIYNASRIFDRTNLSNLSSVSQSAQAFDGVAKQIALNRASAEEGYKTASTRFSDIQTLLNKVNDAPDAKDIADLSARIQAEQVMMQNEAIKLQQLAALAQAQKDLQIQQATELRMNSTRGERPAGW